MAPLDYDPPLWVKELTKDHRKFFLRLGISGSTDAQARLPKATGQIWNVLPRVCHVGLRNNATGETCSGIVEGTAWQPTREVAGLEVAKIYAERNGKRVKLRGPNFRPSAILGDPARAVIGKRPPDDPPPSLRDSERWVAVNGFGTERGIAGELVTERPNDASHTTSYQNWNVWGIHASEALSYRSYLDEWPVVRNKVKTTGHTTTHASAELLTLMLGLRPEVASKCWRGLRKKPTYARRGDIVHVRYDARRPEETTPSLVVSPDEFNSLAFNGLVVLQCDPHSPDKDGDPLWREIGPIAGDSRQWMVGIHLVRGLSRASQRIDLQAPQSDAASLLASDIDTQLRLYYA